MNYRLEEIGDVKFEKLIGALCQKILGMGTVIFSSGKDGGRDAQFEGTAELYPSAQEPWKGLFIIQAKHTSNSNASCSDSEFERTLNDEIKRIKKLKASLQIDNYLLFTNRKFTGIKGAGLVEKIRRDTEVINVAIIGRETIHLYLDSNKEIVRQFKLGTYLEPLSISDEEIKKVIIEFKSQLPCITASVQKRIEELKYDYSHIEKDEKNKKNRLTEDYYTNEILGRSLPEFVVIDQFLKNPINEEFKNYYYDSAHEFNQLIVFNRDKFNTFEESFHFIYQSICNDSTTLSGAKRHVTLFLHYMYIECLLGQR